MERLIKLIDDGDPEVILAEDALVPKFNELLKYELVVIKEDRVFLTEKGKIAKARGLEYILQQEKLPKTSVKKTIAARISGKKYSINYLPMKLRMVHLLVLLLLLTMAFLYFYLPVAEN